MDEKLFNSLKDKFVRKAKKDYALLSWNGIDYTTRSWVEVKDKDGRINYLEKNDAPFQLAVETSIPDLWDEYGDNNFPAGAIKDGRLIEFEGETELDDYVRNTFGAKTEEDIENEINDLLQTPLENLKYSFSESSRKVFLKSVEDKDLYTLGDLLDKTPEELSEIAGSKNVACAIQAVNELGIEYGEDFLESQMNKSREEYMAAFRKFISDNEIDPYELHQLEELKEKLGLSDSEVKSMTGEYIKERYKNTILTPVVAKRLTPDNPEDIHRFAECFNEHKAELMEKIAEENTEKPAPYLNDMNERIASIVLESLEFDDSWTVYADFDHNKFWREDKYSEECEEVSQNHLVDMADDIIHSWHRDETTISENKIVEDMESFYDRQILVPVDIKYNFTLPKEVITDASTGLYNPEAAQESLDVITDLFSTDSELIDDFTQVTGKGLDVSFEIRHNLVCSPDTNYDNINFSEINNNMQYLTGKALNDHFGVEQKILFSDLLSHIPEKFYDEHGRRIATVNKEIIDVFAQSSEEYSRSLSLENLREAGTSVWKETERFEQEKNQFLSVLEKNPLLKSYVQDKWIKRLKEKEIERQKAEENQETAVENFFEKVSESCKDDKSIGNILLQASRIIRESPQSEKELIRSGLKNLNLSDKEEMQKYFANKISPKKERKIERKRDLDYERGR
jgi:hypothetical protein